MIRRITKDDKDLFIKLSDAFYSSDAVLAPVPSEYHTIAFNELMRSDEYLECFIFESNNVPAGYALLNKMFQHEAGGMVVWIEELFVLPEYRSHGLGSEFFDYLEKNIPAVRYRLEIEPENEKAIKLYQRMGFCNLPYSQMIKDI